jgi:hypothetical protein
MNRVTAAGVLFDAVSLPALYNESRFLMVWRMTAAEKTDLQIFRLLSLQPPTPMLATDDRLRGSPDVDHWRKSRHSYLILAWALTKAGYWEEA